MTAERQSITKRDTYGLQKTQNESEETNKDLKVTQNNQNNTQKDYKETQHDHRETQVTKKLHKMSIKRQNMTTKTLIISYLEFLHFVFYIS